MQSVFHAHLSVKFTYLGCSPNQMRQTAREVIFFLPARPRSPNQFTRYGCGSRRHFSFKEYRYMKSTRNAGGRILTDSEKISQSRRQRHGGDLGYQYVRGYFGTIVFHVILVTELGGLLALLPMPQAQRNQTD